MKTQRAKKRFVPSNKNIILSLLVITIVTFTSFFYDESYFLAYSQEGSGGSSSGLEVHPQTEAVTSTYDGLLKAPLIISQAAIVGGVFNHIIFQRVLNRIDTKHRINIENNNLHSQKKFFIILVSCGIAILITGTSLIYLQAFSLSIDLNTDVTTTFTILTSTDVGTVWILRIITASIIIASSFLYYILEKTKIKKKRRRTMPSAEEHQDIQLENKRGIGISKIFLYAIIIAGAICIFSNSLVSHNTALTFLPSLAISVDWLHFMAVAIWIGGLFYISAVLLDIIRTAAKAKIKFESYSSTSTRSDKIESAYFLALLLPYFSVIATISLGIIGITGLYMAWIHLHTAEALFDSSYGNILIIKLSAALPMVVLGAYHQLKLHRSLVEVASMSINIEGRNKRSPLLNSVNNNISLDIYAKFRKTIRIESIIGIGVLFAASFLTITSPPHSSTMMSHGQVAPFMTQTPLSEGSSDLNEIPSSLDSFAILTIILSAGVGMSSAFYLRKSRQQLKKTAEYLQY
ncbi:MAG: CopD family protein [Thermoproteota archaeon]|nr:CopD family protein [Thermoproteota archaeon]